LNEPPKYTHLIGKYKNVLHPVCSCPCQTANTGCPTNNRAGIFLNICKIITFFLYTPVIAMQ